MNGIYFNKEYAQAEYEMHVNRTSRRKGAVGRSPLCYRVARGIVAQASKKAGPYRILDFGCGKEPHLEGVVPGTLTHLPEGISICPYDIGNNAHGMKPVGTYDLVILSNVLNVQPTDNLLKLVLLDAWFYVAEGGILLCNYPKKPRHCGVSDQQVWELLAALSPCAKNSLGQYYLASPNKGVYQITKGSS